MADLGHYTVDSHKIGTPGVNWQFYDIAFCFENVTYWGCIDRILFMSNAFINKVNTFKKEKFSAVHIPNLQTIFFISLQITASDDCKAQRCKAHFYNPSHQ